MIVTCTPRRGPGASRTASTLFVLRQLARLRTDWLTDVATAIDRVATGWAMFFAAIA